MKTDLEIAREATMEAVEAVAWKLGISSHEIEPMGQGVAKVKWSALKTRFNQPQGNLVLVTSVNPTPFGEGKTVTTIGLTQALCHIGKSATCVVREPSMGPVFGIKGGAAGGGYAQVLPMENINLHLTGDLHAVTSAHNLLSALIDNHLKHGNPSGLEWMCIGPQLPQQAHIHGAPALKHLLKQLTASWNPHADWTESIVSCSQDQWNTVQVQRLSYNSTVQISKYFFQPRAISERGDQYLSLCTRIL